MQDSFCRQNVDIWGVVTGGASDNWREDILQNVHLNDREVYTINIVIKVKVRRTVCEDGNISGWVPWQDF
jgi:hypothetical protein